MHWVTLSLPFIFLPSFLLPLRFSPQPQAPPPSLNSHWQLTSSCLLALCASPVYLTPVCPGAGEQCCVYLPYPFLVHPLACPPLPGVGTLWSLALNLPSDWQLTTGATLGGVEVVAVGIGGVGEVPKVSFHQLCKGNLTGSVSFSTADGQCTLDEASMVLILNQKLLGEWMLRGDWLKLWGLGAKKMCGFQQKGKRKHMYPCLTLWVFHHQCLTLIGSVTAGMAFNGC